MGRKSTVSEIGIASWSGHWAGVGLGYALPFIIFLAMLLFWGAIFLAIALVVIAIITYTYTVVSNKVNRIDDPKAILGLAKEQHWLEFNSFITKKCRISLLSDEEFLLELISVFIQQASNAPETEKEGEYADLSGGKCHFNYRVFLELKMILSKIDTKVSYNKLFLLKVFQSLKSDKLIDGEYIINCLIRRTCRITETVVLEGWISDNLRNDEEFMLKTLECFDKKLKFQRALEAFEFQLKKKPELICKFENKIKDKYTLKNVLSTYSYSCKPLVKLLVKMDGMEIRHAKNSLKDDKEIAMEAVKNNGEALKYLSYDMRNDKEVVMESAKKDWRALNYASYDLQNDKEIVMEAVKNNYCAICNMGNELKSLYKDKGSALEAIKAEGLELMFASEDLQDDKELAMEAVKNNGLSLMVVSETLEDDKELVMEAVKSNGMALKYASERLQNNKEIVMEAVKNNRRSVKFASKKLKEAVLAEI